MNMELFCVLFQYGYTMKPVFIYAESAQNAVNQFRYNRFETIIDVFLMEKVGGWE